MKHDNELAESVSASQDLSTMEITAVERFDRKKLAYIVNNWDNLPLDRIDKTAKDQALKQLRKYWANASNGRISVTYYQPHTGGRYMARDGLSQQSMIREVRHTIAGHLYIDIDIVNAAPTTLQQYCVKRNIPCPALTSYVNGREKKLKELQDVTGSSRDEVKQNIITFMNGGRCFQHVSPDVLPTWVFTFEREMDEIRNKVFSTEAEYAKMGIKKAEENLKEGRWANVNGSTLCYMLQTIENQVLMAMRDYLIKEKIIKQSKGEYVLVYDGIQLRKEDIDEGEVNKLMRAMEKAAYERTGYAVKLKDKPMDQVIPLPDNITGPEDMVIISRGDNEASRLFLERLGDDIRRCQGIIYVRQNGIWTSNTTEVDYYLLDRCLEMNFVKEGEKGKIINYSDNVSGATPIIKATKARIKDSPNFVRELSDSNRGKVVFLDGYYDFEQRCFVEGFEGVHSTIQVNRTFPRERNEQLITEVKSRILIAVLGNKKVPFLQFLARAIAGQTDDKVWGVLLGERNCGKGVLGTLIQKCIGAYMTTICPDSLLCQRLSFGGDEPKRYSWSTVMEFTRLTMTNEIKLDQDTNLKIDGNAIKRLSGGSSDKIMVRSCYQEAREMTIQSTLLLACNDLPDIAPKDATETLVAFQCPHKFSTDPELIREYDHVMEADTAIKVFAAREDVADAFFHIIIDHYRDQPVTLTQDMKDFREDFAEDDEMKVINEAFHVTSDDKDFVLNTEIQDFLSTTSINMTIKKFSLIMTNRGAVRGKEKAGKQRRGYYKLKRIQSNQTVES